MRLLSTSFDGSGLPELREFNDTDRPPYAILSHTWGSEEILFANLKSPEVTSRASFRKIWSTLDQARRDGLRWCWIDTVCINKDSSAELSEAINAMYAWYEQAQICYVYLSDFDSPEKAWSAAFCRSRWFTRGWTLQELLAPIQILFFDRSWRRLGTLQDLADEVATATGIGTTFLIKSRSIYTASIARRMSWAATRSTTRTEDLAYCLMGLFSVNMPMLYGEGSRAFTRLQDEIMKVSDDQSIFAWRAKCEGDRHGLLADSPAAFQDSGDAVPVSGLSSRRQHHLSHAMTNRGLRIELPSRSLNYPDAPFLTGPITVSLECQMQSKPGFIRLTLHPTTESMDHYARGECEQLTLSNEPLTIWSSVYVRQNIPTSLTHVQAAFQYVTLLDFTTNAAREGRPRIMKGYYLDVLGQGGPWQPSDPDAHRYPIPIIRQANVLSAFLTLPDNPIGKIAVLIGFDDSRQLAFDVWEATTAHWILEYARCQGESGARPTMPSFLAAAFDPQPPGTKMTKLQKYDITVTVDANPDVANPLCGLRIYCYKKVEMAASTKSELPAYDLAATSASKGKSSTGNLWKNMTSMGQRKSQPS